MRKRLLLAALTLIFGCEEVQPPAPPQFSALSFTEIGPNTARVNAQLERLGDALIQEHGFVAHEDSSTLDVLNGSKLGSVQRSTPVPVTMSSVTSGLKPNTPYYAAAYALVNDAPVLGKIYSFRTSAIVQPGIRTDAADNINPISARIKGTLLSKGTHDISEYGLVYATAENPTTALTTKHRVSGNVTNFPLAFTYTAPNLTPATTYHFRAYVIANGVTSYGQNLSFRTAAVTQPSVQTDQTSVITTSTAVLHGRVTAAGTYPITERGIVWGAGANPTTANSKASHAGNVSSFPSTYSVTAQNLAMNTTYNYRAYVIANGVTTYGENKTFKTLNLVLPQIRTDAVRPSATSALAFGVITAKGSHPITEYGIVYGNGANPTTSGNKKTQAGDVAAVPHSYNFTLDNLSPGNTYYYRAYAIMNGQTIYGESLSFQTTDAQRPVVRTDEAKPGTHHATAFGTLVSGGTFPISEYGIVLSSGRNPTVNDRKSGINGNVTTFPTRFSMDIDDLNAVARYYYRAFVISNGEVIYGNEAEFTTGYDAPVLTTSAATNVTFTSATLNGTISSPGSFPITEAGIVWATTNNPTSANNKLVHNVSGVSYPYRFSINATTIPRLTALYCRTYVITNGQTYYGNTVSFTTNR